MKNDITPLIPVLISACLLLLLSFGYRAGFGLFMQPISEARSWGRDVFSLALALQNLSSGVIAVLAGGLADRYGNLKIILAIVISYTVGMWSMAYAAEAHSHKNQLQAA
jgi:MFS family permease